MFRRPTLLRLTCALALTGLVAGCGMQPGSTAQSTDPGYSAYAGDTGADDTFAGYNDNNVLPDDTYGGTDAGPESPSPYASPEPSPTPTPAPSVSPTPTPSPALEAWVTRVKEYGMIWDRKISAEVEVNNPTKYKLSGRLNVRFTDNGRLAANSFGRRVELQPHSTTTIVFETKGWRLDNAEATIDTDALDE